MSRGILPLSPTPSTPPAHPNQIFQFWHRQFHRWISSHLSCLEFLTAKCLKVLSLKTTKAGASNSLAFSLRHFLKSSYRAFLDIIQRSFVFTSFLHPFRFFQRGFNFLKSLIQFRKRSNRVSKLVLKI